MARSRLLKPGFFTNDDLAELPMAARLLFAGLWTLADRAGRLEDRPRRIKAEVLPYDNEDVDALLQSLTARGFIVRYEAAGNSYIAIVNFLKHQSPHVREPDSVIPAPDKPDASTVQAPDKPDASTASRAHSPIPHSGIRSPIPETVPSAPNAAMRDEPETISDIREVTDERPHGMVAAFCAAIGSDIGTLAPDWISRQRSVAKRLLEKGYGIDKVIACAGYRQSQEWRDEPFDLFDIEKGIGKWEAAGSPRVARSRSPTNGTAPKQWGGPIDTSDKFLVNGMETSDDDKQQAEAIYQKAKARQRAEAGL